MLKEDDPLYPCNAIAEKYRRECYFLQSSAISLFNDNDFGATLKVCDTVPTKYVQVCYQSTGRDISGFTLGTASARSTTACWATIATRATVSSAWSATSPTRLSTDDGLAFCDLVPEASDALLRGDRRARRAHVRGPGAKDAECDRARGRLSRGVSGRHPAWPGLTAGGYPADHCSSTPKKLSRDSASRSNITAPSSATRWLISGSIWASRPPSGPAPAAGCSPWSSGSDGSAAPGGY